jgi:hypothetical protein
VKQVAATTAATTVVATAAVQATGDYLVQLRPRPGTDAVHNLRGALKMLLRRYDLQAIRIEEIGLDRSA